MTNELAPEHRALKELAPTERTRLAECEAIIERGLQTFVEVGAALLAIRDARLYREQHGTFEDYCRERWGISRPRAYQLIEAAEAVNSMSTTGDILPTSERQARPLTRLAPDEQRAAWQAAVETAPRSELGAPIITAAHVARVVEERKSLLQAHADGDALTPQQSRMVPKFERLQELEEQGVYIGSVWSFGRRVDYAGRGDYHGNSIPQIVENAVLLYTAPGALVIDPMAGSGTTVDVCAAIGRGCLAFDIQPENARPGVQPADARELPVGDAVADLVFWHPPYWNMVTYSTERGDLSRMGWFEFLEACREVMLEVARVLKPGGRLVLLSGDKVEAGRFYPITRNLANLAEQAGLVDCGVAIKTTINSASQIVKGKTIWAELAYTQNLKVEHDTIGVFQK